MTQVAKTSCPDTHSLPHLPPPKKLESLVWKAVKKQKTTEELTMALIPVLYGAKQCNERFLLTSNI